MLLGGLKTGKNMKKYFEKELGKIDPTIKKIKLSKNIRDVLSGKHDNDPPFKLDESSTKRSTKQ